MGFKPLPPSASGQEHHISALGKCIKPQGGGVAASRTQVQKPTQTTGHTSMDTAKERRGPGKATDRFMSWNRPTGGHSPKFQEQNKTRIEHFQGFHLCFWNNLHPFPRPEVLYYVYLWGPSFEPGTLPTEVKHIVRGSGLSWGNGSDSKHSLP